MKATFLIFAALGIVGCANPPNRDVLGTSGNSIQVTDNLKYTINKRPVGTAILANYDEYTFLPINLANLKNDCVEIGYNLADRISGENDRLLQMIDGSLFVEASRNEVTGVNSCFIKFRMDVTK